MKDEYGIIDSDEYVAGVVYCEAGADEVAAAVEAAGAEPPADEAGAA